MFDTKCNVLLIDDDPDILTAYQDLLIQEGYIVEAISEPQYIIHQIPSDWIGIVLCDVLMPHISGLTVLEEIVRIDPQIPVIMITGHGDIPMAVNALKLGAANFLEKPVSPENLLIQVENALNKRRHFVEKRLWQQEKLNQELIGHSEWIIGLRNQLVKLADSRLPVFLWGEKGTGRHLSATNLHQLGSRKNSPLHFYECLESNSYELESFISNSQKGTLVIKNLHLFSLKEQQLLSSALHNENNDIRLIVISDIPLLQLIQQYHLSVELYSLFIHTQIELLPLRKHPMDIVDIFLHYVNKSCLQLQKNYHEPSKKLLQYLSHRQWNGNVAELISIAELYSIGLFSDPSIVNLENAKIKIENINPLMDQINQYEKQIIEDALISFQGKINDVANYLDIPRKKLYLRMQKYGIDKKDYKF